MPFNATYAGDIEETILAALGTIFTNELMGLAGDALSLATLKVAPLQDDPTRVAPYLVYGPDPKKGTRPMKHEEAHEYGDAEIGGPIRFVRYFEATCGVGFAGTREQALAAINNLTNRVMKTVVKYFDLAGVLAYGPLASQDGSEVIEGANPFHLIDDSTTVLEGGETTWFGTGHVFWHYPVSWNQPYRVFTGSVLAH